MEDNSKRYEEERKRIMQKYGGPAQRKPESSRYLEFRRKESLVKEMAEHPEKFIEPSEEKAETVPAPIIEPIEEAPKKKSWLSSLFKK